jgi:hypothetical protein
MPTAFSHALNFLTIGTAFLSLGLIVDSGGVPMLLGQAAKQTKAELLVIGPLPEINGKV